MRKSVPSSGWLTLPFAAEFIENIRKTQIELDSFQALLEEHPEGVEKLNLAHVESGLREKLWKQFEAMPGVTVVSSAGSNIELNRDAGRAKGMRCIIFANGCRFPRRM